MRPAPRTVASATLVVLLVTTGCVGVLTGSESLEFAATPVAVSDAARDEAGYEEVRVEPYTLTREFTVSGQTREVTVTNHLAEYSRSVAVGPLGTGTFARFAVVSTPQIEVLGRPFNPVGDMSNRELVERVQGQYEGLENVRATGERSATLLGSPTTVSTFAADARVGATGQSIELTFHVARVQHEGDFVIAIGVHPSLLEGEVPRVDAMLAGVEHGSD